MSTPKTSMKTKLSFATTLTGTKTDIGYVQEIPALRSASEPINYGALDLTAEQQAKGMAKAETIEIPVLFTEEQHDTIKALADAETEVYWFIQLPPETATTTGKPLTWYFKATVDLINDTISIDNMLQEKITLYRSSSVSESKGYPGAVSE